MGQGCNVVMHETATRTVKKRQRLNYSDQLQVTGIKREIEVNQRDTEGKEFLFDKVNQHVSGKGNDE